MPHHERTIATPHADIRLTDTEGAGLPVLLLHGSASSRSVFDRQFGSQLAERHRLIAIDQNIANAAQTFLKGLDRPNGFMGDDFAVSLKMAAHR